MLKSLLLIIICAVALPGFCEPSAKYRLATILEVQQHQSAGESSSTSGASYDVFVKVGDTTYGVLYTDKMGSGTVKYVAGRQLLVHVGNTFTYNHISGRSQEVPIVSQRLATAR
jgi:hypothetical protein